MHPQICALLNATTPTSNNGRCQLLSIPLPQSLPMDIILLTLISTYLAHALSTLVSISTPQAVDAMSSSLTLPTSFSFLTWVPSIFSLPVKQTDTMLTRSHSEIMKLYSTFTSTTSSTAKTKADNSSPNPEQVFQLWMYALRCLCHSSRGTVESGTFWEWVTRSSVALIKASQSLFPKAEEKVTNLVLCEYMEMLVCAQKQEGGLLFVEGKGFAGFCEYWMAFAKWVSLFLPIIVMTHWNRDYEYQSTVTCIVDMHVTLSRYTGQYHHWPSPLYAGETLPPFPPGDESVVRALTCLPLTLCLFSALVSFLLHLLPAHQHCRILHHPPSSTICHIVSPPSFPCPLPIRRALWHHRCLPYVTIPEKKTTLKKKPVSQAPPAVSPPAPVSASKMAAASSPLPPATEESIAKLIGLTMLSPDLPLGLI